jgi:integrase
VSVVRAVRNGRTRWEVRWRDGGRHRSRTFDLKRDAEAFERAMARRRQLGAHAPAEPGRELLSEWLKRWWETRSGAWAHSTRLQRAGVLDRWIVPYVGGVRLRDLGPARVRQFFAEIQAAGCPPTTAHHALGVLSAALGWQGAVGEGLLPANPCTGVRRLPLAPARPRALTPLEVERLRAAMPTPRDAVMVGLLAYAGLRPGEVLALIWESVGRTLVVDRSVSEGHLKGTKTNRRRSVEIVAPLAEDLEALRPARLSRGELVAPGAQGQPLELRTGTAASGVRPPGGPGSRRSPMTAATPTPRC